jgi:hypothetical protein
MAEGAGLAFSTVSKPVHGRVENGLVRPQFHLPGEMRQRVLRLCHRHGPKARAWPAEEKGHVVHLTPLAASRAPCL